MRNKVHSRLFLLALTMAVTVILAGLFIAFPTPALAVDANGDGYDDNDTAKINGMIENNGLEWTLNDPSSWPVTSSTANGRGVLWNTDTPKRVIALNVSPENAQSPRLTGALDWSGMTMMSNTWFGGNDFTSLDFSGNIAMITLYCGSDKIDSLNVSGCTALEDLSCQRLDLTTLDVSGCTSLDALFCSENNLTTLNLSGCTTLRALYCSDNPLPALDASGLTSLETLHCNNNSLLTSLTVSGLPSLTDLQCYNNALTSLDVSGCTALSALRCFNNFLTSLDVSGCTALTGLRCYNNFLTSLDVSDCADLYALLCYNNYLSLVEGGGVTGIENLTWFVSHGGWKTELDGDYVYLPQNDLSAFVGVASITGVPQTATAGTPLALTGTVAPDNAVNTIISWSVKDAGATGATLNGSTLSVGAAGIVTVTATVVSGAAPGINYTQDFTITVASLGPVPDSAWRRLSGLDRYDTMAAISQEGFADNSGGTVIIAHGGDFPDALAASGLAGLYEAPILLTEKAALSPQTAAEITRIGAAAAVIVGGPGSVSPEAEQQIKELLGDANVSRVAGADRFATARAVYESGQSLATASGSAWSGEAVIASGGGFADALSIAPYAYATGSPVFLVDPSTGLNEAVAATVKDGGFTRVILVGGTGSVPAVVPDQLGIDPADTARCVRLGGADRYQTSALIARFGVEQGALGYDGLATATGEDFPDALAGGALTGRLGSVLVLVSDNEAGRHCLDDIIQSNRVDIGSGLFLGGPGVISEPFAAAIEAAAH